mgnify:CR=1 FL=1
MVARPNDSAEREFVASMMGEATLVGNGNDALFAGGRFRGFATGEDVPPGGAVTLLVCDGVESARLETTTCFSFESDGARGVRVLESSEPTGVNGDGPPAWQLVTDFSFVDELGILVVGSAVTGPFGSAPVTDLVHLGLPIPEDCPIVASSCYPDGSRAEGRLEAHGLHAVAGSQVTLETPWGVITVAFVDRDGHVRVGAVWRYPSKSPLLALGGVMRLGRNDEGPEVAERTLLIAAGETGQEEIRQALRGRLPASLAQELRRGPVTSRSVPGAQPEA